MVMVKIVLPTLFLVMTGGRTDVNAGSLPSLQATDQTEWQEFT